MPSTDVLISEIPLASPIQIVHDGFKIVVIRTETQIFAFEDSCPHAYWPLSEGEFVNGILECPGHGWEFDVATGRCLNAPANCLAPVAVQIHSDVVQLNWELKQKPSGS